MIQFPVFRYSKFKFQTALWILGGMFLLFPLAGTLPAVTLDEPADFSDDVTGDPISEGWNAGSGGTEADSGQGGVGDHARRYASGTNFHFFTASNSIFLGDYTAANVVELEFDARHTGLTDSVDLRLYLFSGFPSPGAPHARSVAPLSITTADTSWTTYTMPLLVSGLVAFNGTAADVLASVSQIGFRHDPNGEQAGTQTPLPTGAAIYFDNITLRGATTGSADFDNSGIVDGLDFLKWQIGMTPNPTSPTDLALWEAQYGGPPPLAANTVAVPEPTGAMLVGVVVVSLLNRRSRNRT